jgi:hypothetical protein
MTKFFIKPGKNAAGQSTDSNNEPISDSEHPNIPSDGKHAYTEVRAIHQKMN